MTFKSRRKRPIILLLALTATTALSLPTLGVDDESNAESRQARRQKINERIKNAPTLKVSGSTLQPPKAPLPDDPERTRLQINIEPPNREQLFKLQTADTIIDVKRAELAKDSTGDGLPTPGPIDRFNVSNNDRLGPLWLETVVFLGGYSGNWNPGYLGVRNHAGRYPLREEMKPPMAAAVMKEYIPTTDMLVGVDVNLSHPGNEFGVVLRAKAAGIEPPVHYWEKIEQNWKKLAESAKRKWAKLSDRDLALVEGKEDRFVELLQRITGDDKTKIEKEVRVWAEENTPYHFISSGQFYAVTATADKVQLRKMENDKISVIKVQEIQPKTSFRLTARAVGDGFEVYRDAELVLAAEDGSIKGHYAGVIGVKADAGAVTFDDYEAKNYAGEFKPRMWAASTRLYRGANVHYNTLYFEQRGLERHGHHLGNPFHPFIAHSLFFVDVALLPMSLGRSGPEECYASDLYARPGDLVPFFISCPEMTAKSLLYEAAVLTPIFILAP